MTPTSSRREAFGYSDSSTITIDYRQSIQRGYIRGRVPRFQDQDVNCSARDGTLEDAKKCDIQIFASHSRRKSSVMCGSTQPVTRFTGIVNLSTC